MNSRRIDTHVIEHIGVVVPAHNEADDLPRCLASIAAALERISIPATVVVVLDSCTDRSEAVVRTVGAELAMAIVVVRCDARAVGAARSAGVDALLERTAPAAVHPSRVWITNTDADTCVPGNWLRDHLAYAQAGCRVVAGTVSVIDWSGWSVDVQELYRSEYDRALLPDGHGHVHGANLGIRGDVYVRAGGFPHATSDEDVTLVALASRQGAPVTWASELLVFTSSRPHARAPLGFAEHLRLLKTLRTLEAPAASA